MSITRSIATATATALLALPSAAIAVGPPTSPGADHRPAGAKQGHDAPASVKAKAYGKHCQGKSKKHVAGEKGTPFSRCVVAAKKKRADQPA